MRGNNSNEATRAGWFGHWTFSHRDPRVLRHMPDCTNAPASWRNMKLDNPCRSCLRATVNRVHSPYKNPRAAVPGEIVSMDGWSCQTIPNGYKAKCWSAR